MWLRLKLFAVWRDRCSFDFNNSVFLLNFKKLSKAPNIHFSSTLLHSRHAWFLCGSLSPGNGLWGTQGWTWLSRTVPKGKAKSEWRTHPVKEALWKNYWLWGPKASTNMEVRFVIFFQIFNNCHCCNPLDSVMKMFPISWLNKTF